VGEACWLGDRVQVEGHGEKRAGERTQGSSGPELRRAGRGMNQVEPELAGQADGLRATGEHRLGADVDVHTSDAARAKLPAQLRGALEHEDGESREIQLTG